MDIVDKLRFLLGEHMSLSGIEKELKMGNGIIGKWRKQSPSCDKISKVADYLDCSVDYLLGRTDDPNAHKSFVHDGQAIELSNKNLSSNLSENNLSSIKKYNELDLHGKSLVDTIIDKEYSRCTKSQTSDTAQLSDNDTIETPKGKYKVAYVAAFGGGTTEIYIPADVSADEINSLAAEKTAEQQRIENEKIGDEIIEKIERNK